MDYDIQCCDCNNVFSFTAGEQEFYKTKNLQPPKRCRDCRAAKKEKLGKGKRIMHDAICTECGEPCTVPFEPKEGRPVYCLKHLPPK